MGKYDCTKARDFIHEISRMKDFCKGKTCNECCSEVDKSGICPLDIGKVDRWKDITDDEFQEIVACLQEWSDSHPERRELTGDEIAVLSGIKLLRYEYIAADKNRLVWAYAEMPIKEQNYWNDRCGGGICISSSGLFNGIADFSDEKPLVIDEILNERK